MYSTRRDKTFPVNFKQWSLVSTDVVADLGEEEVAQEAVAEDEVTWVEAAEGTWAVVEVQDDTAAAAAAEDMAQEVAAGEDFPGGGRGRGR